MHEHLVGVDGLDLLVDRAPAGPDRVVVGDAEGQDVPVVDRVDDGVGVQAVPEHLLGGPEKPAAAGVLGEDRGAGEAEEVVVLERPADRGAHVAELAPVALVEDEDEVPAINLMALVLADEPCELLDRRDDNLRLGVFQTLLELAGVPGAVDGSLLEPLVLKDRLVVEVLSVDDEEHLVDAG